MISTAKPITKPVSWWTRERVRNGLARLARDYFDGDDNNLPQTSYGFRNALPTAERRRARHLRLYPPYVAVLRQYQSLLAAWIDLGFNVSQRPNKNVAADIAGWTFCYLTAVAYSHSAPGSGRIWRCRCKCGRESFAAVKNLFRGRVLSCGCYRRTVLSKIVALKNTRQLTGKKFGRLTAARIVGKYQKQSLWECVCDCGGVVKIPTSSLTRGATRSCGCLRAETTTKRITNYWEKKRSMAEITESLGILPPAILSEVEPNLSKAREFIAAGKTQGGIEYFYYFEKMKEFGFTRYYVDDEEEAYLPTALKDIYVTARGVPVVFETEVRYSYESSAHINAEPEDMYFSDAVEARKAFDRERGWKSGSIGTSVKRYTRPATDEDIRKAIKGDAIAQAYEVLDSNTVEYRLSNEEIAENEAADDKFWKREIDIQNREIARWIEEHPEGNN